ncbi:DUF4388 domain-containing protein [Meiothermus ruber]|jgi:hypothetical protein|uniref:PatA-like N-terminal domain-containing protein n=1 Tax=Meiothermus ruber (strain ATCC 35948 / DSM 1279 / VKM B-1258 / 21) TaxID=504728 RepID=D3PMP1_MEIRD|nr:DUF4388 domain-containing protein [Meiothermus ruber]ADD27216.1 hypothetical protein Mrub_0439 [Meiothermus ruber DSM 1279]AGK03668.1 hypothetical protein K649_01820 [Meiothermus ruber DSM 1279]MCL6530970.1 DUF4388 domain-containing protein [Meiothermus ruber]MCX7802215.1 DUF4388 domain-containing protein [Meiothermus ruber]GAO74139.1 putative uncharacterized protein [Meiothermus ruber H328]
MDGTFELLGPIELLQLLSQARQTGAFKVPGGEVYLERGQPVHAQYRGQVGKDGLFQILALKEGKFRFLAGERARQSSLQGTLDNYLLEAIRFMDARLDLSPFDQVQLADAQRTTHLTLSPDEFELLRHMSKPISLFDLAAASGLSSEVVHLNVSRLARLGLVRITTRTPHTVRLVVARLEGAPEARIDTQLLRAWRSHFGAFTQIEVRTEDRTLQMPVAAASSAGPQLLLSSDALFFYNLRVGQEVLVWPSL